MHACHFIDVDVKKKRKLISGGFFILSLDFWVD